MSGPTLPVRAYCSPSGVALLAFHWKPKANQPFFGFSIKRTPGFHDPNSGLQLPFNWLPNRLNFHGPLDEDAASNVAPIQKFMWWDARFHPKEDAGKTFTYEVKPMGGSADALAAIPGVVGRVSFKLPNRDDQAIATWFNRPFVSSQAFSRLLQRYGVDAKAKLADLSPQQREGILGWLSNDLQDAVVDFLKQKSQIDGAIYHFSDTQWLKPAFAGRTKKNTSVTLHWKKEGKTKKIFVNEDFKKKLGKNVQFHERTKIPSLMHDKILVVSTKGGSKNKKKAQKVLMGSANFTTGALTSQANVLHVFSVPALAQLYLDRVELLAKDTPKGRGKSNGLVAEWSKPVSLSGGATVRVFFPPEPGDKKTKGPGQSVLPIVAAVKKAKSSVLFCYFSSTDEGVQKACFDTAKRGLMMFGLVNQIASNEPTPGAGKQVSVELFHRSRKQADIVGAASLLSGAPPGWLREIFSLGAGDKPPAKGKKSNYVPDVHIHHKFILIDGETDNPVLFVGSANISANSAYKNDENLLEIRGAKALSRVYLAEFMRLYEHYRFRFVSQRDGKGKKPKPLRLDDTGLKWFTKYFKPGAPEARAAKRLAGA